MIRFKLIQYPNREIRVLPTDVGTLGGDEMSVNFDTLEQAQNWAGVFRNRKKIGPPTRYTRANGELHHD